MSDLLVENVRSARDLRAAIIKLAIAVGNTPARGQLIVSKSDLSPQKIDDIWREACAVLDPAIRRRIRYYVPEPPEEAFFVDPSQHVNFGKPNYRYELLRLLLHSIFEHGVNRLAMGDALQAIGASETPIRRAADDLRRFGLLSEKARRIELAVKVLELDFEVLTAAEAAPRQLKFRFGLGAQVRSPMDLIHRARKLVVGRRSDEWGTMALSGVNAALDEYPDLDIAGIPRVDLMARVSREFGIFDTYAMHKLNPGLELEEKGLALTPVVVTATRADLKLDRSRRGVRCAARVDVFLSLLSSALPEIARQYAKRMCAT